MNASCRAKRVAPYNRIVGGIVVCVARDTVSEYFFSCERSRSISPSKPQVHEHQFHGGVADTLAERKRSGMNLVRAGGHGAPANWQPPGRDRCARANPREFFPRSASRFLPRRTAPGCMRPAAWRAPPYRTARSPARPRGSQWNKAPRSVSGSVRMVSSVTYMTGSSPPAANFTASSVVRCRCSTLQSSTSRRIGLDPRKVRLRWRCPHAAKFRRSARMSLLVRARGAIRMRIFIRELMISRASASVSANARGPAPGKPDVHGLDSQRFHQMQDFDFFVDGGIANRGVLQAVAQGLVIDE